MKEWKTEKIKYFVIPKSSGQIIKNQAFKESSDNLYPAFSASGQDVWLPNYIYDGDAIIVSAVGARCGKTFLASGKWGLCANTHALLTKPTINSKFLNYILNNENFWEKGGAAQPFVKIIETLNKKIYVPSILTQEKIANYLDEQCSKIDSLISNIQKQISQLEEYKKSVITEAVTKGLDPNVEMKDSGIEWIGDIPKSWRVCKIKNIIDSTSYGIKCGPFGSALTGKVINDGEIVIYGQWNIVSSDFTIRRNTISYDNAKYLTAYVVKSNDILVSMMGTIGKCIIVPQNISHGIMDSHVIKIRLNKNNINARFFVYVYDKDNSNIVINYFSKNKKGSIMDGLNTSIIKNAVIVLPNLKVQQQIVNYLDIKCEKIDKTIELKKQQLSKLEEYKKSLIYECVTGKREVK